MSPYRIAHKTVELLQSTRAPLIRSALGTMSLAVVGNIFFRTREGAEFLTQFLFFILEEQGRIQRRGPQPKRYPMNFMELWESRWKN